MWVLLFVVSLLWCYPHKLEDFDFVSSSSTEVSPLYILGWCPRKTILQSLSPSWRSGSQLGLCWPLVWLLPVWVVRFWALSLLVLCSSGSWSHGTGAFLTQIQVSSSMSPPSNLGEWQGWWARQLNSSIPVSITSQPPASWGRSWPHCRQKSLTILPRRGFPFFFLFGVKNPYLGQVRSLFLAFDYGYIYIYINFYYSIYFLCFPIFAMDNEVSI